jgi:TRAP-type C4-dicarboxylate transport system substrate-binding protein
MSGKSNVIKTLATLLLMALPMAVSAPASAAEKEWKMHAVFVPKRPEVQWTQKYFVDVVNERLDGDLNITFYPGGTLGVKDVDILRILPKGNIIQSAILYPGYLSRDEPHLAYLIPAGVAEKPETLLEILPTLREIYQSTYDKWGIRLLGFVGHPQKDVHIFCKEPVNSLEDLKGKKLRVWEKLHADAFEKLGVAAQVVPQNDMYVALQQGVVDCAVYSAAIASTVSLQEVAPYASYLFSYVLHPINIIVSESVWESLSDEERAVMQQAADEATTSSFAEYLDGAGEAAAIAELETNGVTMLAPFSEADQEAFREAVSGTWKELAEGVGGEAASNYEKVHSAIMQAEN